MRYRELFLALFININTMSNIKDYHKSIRNDIYNDKRMNDGWL